MISIQTNVNSLVAQQNLSVNSAFQSKTIQQLTSGYRINQSGDDAAGLAVANKFRSTVAELTQGVANGNDAMAQLQIMDGGMNNISQILDRLKTLATQSASGTFTGNRATLNGEFQNALSEIDRQAQSIGLNTGGAFAKNLDVYLGTGSGSSSLQNGVVTLGLTQSAVDSQSLGMKGMQAVGGAADIGGGSGTSVAKILADGTNKASTATAGATDFYFAGAGFSDANKVKVSVNLAGVTDVSSLVTAFNSAIASAGAGTSQAGSAFQKAAIVASAKTNSDGTTQLAFTSSTAAFQVEAGDQMANALIGNFGSNATGATIKTTVTGGLTAATGSFTPTGKTVRIQGAGLSGPVDLTFSSNTATIGDAVTDLVNKVSANSDLKAAGISLSGSAGSALVFTSARGESFSVMATGDTTNQLGLGSFVTNSSASNAVDYKSITGTSYDYGTAANDQASLQFSINGGAATAVNVDLTAGDAVAAARKTSVINNPAITAGNNTLSFDVDGISVTATLSGAGEKAIATGTPVIGAGGLAITKATASVTTGVTALATHNWSTGAETFTVDVNGTGAQTINLTTNFTLGTNNAALLSEINGQLSGAQASIDGTSHLVITADTAGAGSVVFGGTVANIGATFATSAGANGTNKIMVSLDGGAAKEIDVLNAGSNASFTQAGGAALTSLQAALNTAFGAGNITAAVDASSFKLKLTSNTVGTASMVTVSDLPSGLDTANSGMTAMFGAATITAQGAATTPGSIATTIQSAIDAAAGTGGTNAHATVTVNTDNSISITNDHKGAAHSISAFTGTASASFAGTGTVVAAGANRSGADLQNHLNQVFSSNSTLQPAQLKATWTTSAGTAGTLQITSGNNTNFRINSGSTGSGAATGTAALTAGHDWNAGNEKFRIKVDGGAWSSDITLNTTTTTAAEVLTAVKDALTAASVTGVTATLDDTDHLVLTSDSKGSNSTVQLEGPSAGNSALASLGLKSLQKTADADLGFGVSGASFTSTLSVTSPANHIIDAGGAASANVNGNALSFSALKFGNDAQAITISGNDVDGTQRSTTITLKNIATGAATDNRAGRNIDEAISYINTQLQQSNVATLQKIVAVKENNGGDQINFISSLSSFNVSVASTANADGVNGGASKNVAVGVVGNGANMQVDTKENAMSAVSAIATAIGRLGSAQAAVGKGQNQLGYAVSLAQSQITNFSAAESQIRDANVAQQAANLSKAQVLSQASIAAMAQANSAPQAVLSLLRG